MLEFIGKIPPRADRALIRNNIARDFIEYFEKYINPDANICTSAEFETSRGIIQVDFLITYGENRIAIMCYNDNTFDNFIIDWQDAFLFGEKHVDAIYRFRKKDIQRFLQDCVHLIYVFEKKTFNDRYHLNSPQLVSEELLDQLHNSRLKTLGRLKVFYKKTNEYGDEIGYECLIAERSTSKNQRNWKVLYDFSTRHPGKPFHELVLLRRQASA